MSLKTAVMGTESNKDQIGPHIITPTDETTTVFHGHKKVGDFRVWECKYCDWSGTHPKHSNVNLSIKSDCDGTEWRDTDTIELEDMSR